MVSSNNPNFDSSKSVSTKNYTYFGTTDAYFKFIIAYFYYFKCIIISNNADITNIISIMCNSTYPYFNYSRNILTKCDFKYYKLYIRNYYANFESSDIIDDINNTHINYNKSNINIDNKKIKIWKLL